MRVLFSELRAGWQVGTAAGVGKGAGCGCGCAGGCLRSFPEHSGNLKNKSKPEMGAGGQAGTVGCSTWMWRCSMLAACTVVLAKVDDFF